MRGKFEWYLFAEEFGKAFIFRVWGPKIKSFFMKAGYDDVPYELFGWLFLFVTCNHILHIHSVSLPKISAIVASSSIVILLLTFISWVIIQVLIIFTIIIYLYFSLNITIYKRTKEIGAFSRIICKLYLQTLKEDSHSKKHCGQQLKPEFGVIAKEVTMIYKKVMTGKRFDWCIKWIHYKNMIRQYYEDLWFNCWEVESGGKIADIVDRVIENIRKQKHWRGDECIYIDIYDIYRRNCNNSRSRIICLSYYLLHVMIAFSSQLSNLNSPNLPISFSADSINLKTSKPFINGYLMISFSRPLIISLIEKGDVKGGIKYIPAFMVSSIYFYFIFLAAFGYFFGGISPIG